LGSDAGEAVDSASSESVAGAFEGEYSAWWTMRSERNLVVVIRDSQTVLREVVVMTRAPGCCDSSTTISP
jgi:hypothetical protein